MYKRQINVDLISAIPGQSVASWERTLKRTADLEPEDVYKRQESIGYQTFLGCTGVTGDLIIPGSVTEIGQAAFGGHTNITSITILGKHEGEISGAPWGATSAEIIWELGPATP